GPLETCELGKLLFILQFLFFIASTPPPGRCDVPQRIDVYTDCTSCAASITAGCPRGFTKLHTTNCRVSDHRLLRSYVVQIGGREVELEGCHHLCVRSFLHPQCCPDHWGPLCLCDWSGRTCNFNGVCVDGDVGNGTCICDVRLPSFLCLCVCAVCDCEHGVCNKGPDGDGQCLCQPPYAGTRCDQGRSLLVFKNDFDAKFFKSHCSSELLLSPVSCSQRDCDANAQCSTQATNIRCTCKPGYEGDGRICVPKNPCLENNGGCPLNSTVCVFKGPNKVRRRPGAGSEPEEPLNQSRSDGLQHNTLHRWSQIRSSTTEFCSF
uniref:EGF-like domain-containing protein n=1 Tax=Fundulus heteroclitus TaxID=8078 RepID=A0A3Q2QFF6_FUNHE